jgi:hypothetical protein
MKKPTATKLKENKKARPVGNHTVESIDDDLSVFVFFTRIRASHLRGVITCLVAVVVATFALGYWAKQMSSDITMREHLIRDQFDLMNDAEKHHEYQRRIDELEERRRQDRIIEDESSYLSPKLPLKRRTFVLVVPK